MAAQVEFLGSFYTLRKLVAAPDPPMTPTVHLQGPGAIIGIRSDRGASRLLTIDGNAVIMDAKQVQPASWLHGPVIWREELVAECHDQDAQLIVWYIGGSDAGDELGDLINALQPG